MRSAPPVDRSEPNEPQERPRSIPSRLLSGLTYVFRTIVQLPAFVWWGFAIAILLVLMLVIDIRAARESARRGASLCKMMGLIVAQQNYLDTHGRYPAAGDTSKSQLSWRVRILPYLDEEALYKEFHLDEPWDSEHNRALIPRMPDEFCSLAAEDLPTGKTVYLAVTGPGTAFGDGKTGPTPQDLKDGSSKTVLIVEADPDQAVVWTKPDDWEFDPNEPMHGLGHLYSKGFVVGFADSQTRTIDLHESPTVVKAMMTSAGGEREPLPY